MKIRQNLFKLVYIQPCSVNPGCLNPEGSFNDNALNQYFNKIMLSAHAKRLKNWIVLKFRQNLQPSPIGFRNRRHRDEVFLRRVPERPGHRVQGEVRLRHVQIILSSVGDRIAADHAEPSDDLMHDTLEEALRRRLDLLKRVELLLEQFDRLLVILLCNLRWKIMVEPFSVCLGLNVDRDLTLLIHGAHRANLPLGSEIGCVQIEGFCVQHGP